MTTRTISHRRTAGGSLLALALGLVLALGSFAMLGRGGAQAAGSDWLDATPIADAETCSTQGVYIGGGFYGDVTVVTPVFTGVPVYPFPGYGYGYGYGYAGYPFFLPNVTFETTVISVPQLPFYGEPYGSPTTVTYNCNVFSNCLPIAGDNAVICPGNPASIELNDSLTSASCGSAMNIDAKVLGPSGLNVGDGTPVQFSTNLGMIPAESTTTGGLASASLFFPPKTTGTATVNVTSGNAKATATIRVTC